MGRRRRRRKRRTKLFSSFAHARYVDNVIDQEKARSEQKKHAKKTREIEDDLLTRTIFVTNVKNLNQPHNVQGLRAFMEKTYGKVLRCVKDKYSNRRSNGRPASFPPARVTFATKDAAERVFHGKALRNADPQEILCPSVGHRGVIRVTPSRRDSSMLQDVLTGDRLSFQSQSLSFGHWIPSFDDVYLNWSEEAESNELTKAEEAETFHREAVQQGPLAVSIDLSSRKIEIVLSTEDAASTGAGLVNLLSILMDRISSVFTVRFKEMRDHFSLCKDCSSGRFFLVFATKWPPKLEKLEELEDTTSHQRDITFGSIPSKLIGRCLGFMIEIPDASLSLMLGHKGISKLRKFGVFPKVFAADEALPLNVNDAASHFSASENELASKFLALAQRSGRIAFLARSIVDSGKTSWLHALQRNFTKEGRLFNFLGLVLGETDDERAIDYVEKGLQSMMDCLGSGYTAFPAQVFDSVSSCEYQDAEEIDKKETIPPYCMRIHRVLLTPTHDRCAGMTIDVGNRVIRRFTMQHGFHPSTFVRVRIAEENGEKLFSTQLSSFVEERIKRIMTQGLSLNGELYRFLAYSSSQLKEYSFWMVNPKDGWDVERIRASLGDFSMCTTISKYAARFGQCLSATIQNGDSRTQKSATQKVIPIILADVKSRAGVDKLHSDGTGLISRSLMNDVLRTQPNAPKDLSTISIIQIRYGGAKGTLSAWKHLTTGIHLRKSMVKFNATFENVEVCSVGMSRPYFLNRNLILLLRVHNVDESTFLDMQRVMLDDLDSMLVSNEAAWKTLPALSGSEASINNTLVTMLSFGARPSQDPFLFGCLQSIRLHHIFTLRKKARIFVEKGTVLMGGMDETGTVPEGCVYVQICKPDGQGKDKKCRVIEGAVMVTKHPVMHPGDVRMLLAVDLPCLADHANVILFSKHGARPEADKMAGSDLDGDEFAVSWDTSLFLKGWNECSEKRRLSASVRDLEAANTAPMGYDENTATTPVCVRVPAHQSDYTCAMITHLINLIKNDNLGRISMLWQDYASRYSADCDQCLRLAALHSVAVDFPKSGIPAVLPPDLQLPRDFPVAHWREKKSAAQTIHCSSVIGKLYDEVLHCSKNRQFQTSKAMAGRKVDKYGQILRNRVGRIEREVCDYTIPSRLGFSDLSEEFKESLTSEALSNRREFEAEASAIMNKYGIRSEGELFTGCVRKFNKLHSTNQNVIAEECRMKCRELRRAHRQIFFDTVFDLAVEGHMDHSTAIDEEEDVELLISSNDGGHWSATLRSMAFHLAGAYYLVTYDQSYSQLLDHRGTGTLYAFPWMVADIISQGMMNRRQSQ